MIKDFEENTIQGKARCVWIMFNKGDFTIAKFQTTDGFETMPDKDFSIKGDFYVERGEEYAISAVEDKKSKYPNSYDSIRVARDLDLSGGDKGQIKAFLEGVLSESKAQLLMDSLDDPISALDNEDYEKLTSVDGIGMATAKKLVKEYDSHKDYTLAYVELSRYELTPNAITKICKHFGSPDLAVARIKENPYAVMEVDGFGFTRADEIFLRDVENNKPTDHRRVIAYIDYMFEKQSSDGNSWITPQQFVDGLREYIPNADLKWAVNHVLNSSDYVFEKDFGDDGRISKSSIYHSELAIAREIKRLMEAKCSMDLTGYKDVVKQVEVAKGIEYSEDQLEAIDGMVENNVYMLQGLAGSGKSTVIAGFTGSVDRFGYSYSQCALSGKASDNLAKATGKDGQTIHSLIKYGTPAQLGKDKQLDSSVVILDEISMVDTRIFLALLKSIKSGSKLIMVGDFGQLEAIGIGVMGGLIRSGVVPMYLLKKIHRQAEKSAIITHSIAVRSGVKPKELELDADTHTLYGELNDMKYILTANDKEEDIFKNSIATFKMALQKYEVNDIQILSATKTSGSSSTYKLNNLAQMVYNPISSEKDSVSLGTKFNPYTIQVGDKVINSKNNRATENPDTGEVTPIYNGNTGVVEEISVEKGKGGSVENVVIVNFDKIGRVALRGEDVSSLELGYAITVHRSQGSTIKCVIFALPFHYMLNTKELVYTGMTRASEKLVLVTSPRSFNRSIKNTNVRKRQINLSDMLKKEIN